VPGSLAILGAAVWDGLTAASGTIALSFIVALALALVGTGVVFVTSAVVVLDRFARTARHPGWLAASAAGWACFGAAVASRSITADALGVEADPEQVRLFAALYGAGGTLLAMGLVWLALHRMRPGVMAGAICTTLAVAYGLVMSGAGRTSALVAAMVLALAAGLGLARRRRRRGGEPGAEIWAFLLAAVVAAFAVVAFLLPAPSLEATTAGVILGTVVFNVVLLGLLPLAVAGFAGLRGSVEWFVGLRYLFAKRRQTFISVISLICVGGVATGVWLIITVLSVMNGFAGVWRDEVIGNRAHFTIHSHEGRFGDYDAVRERVETLPEVRAASPFLDAEGMVRGEAGHIVGVRLRGIDPDHLTAVGELEGTVAEGSLDDFAPRTVEGDDGPPVPGIVIGHVLATNLGFRVGDPVLVISPFGGPQTPLGPAPRLKRFRVSGVFKSTMLQYEQVFAYVDLAAAQDFLREDDVVEGVLVQVTDYLRSQPVGEAAQRALGPPFYTIDWKQFFPSFFQALKTERVMMFVLLTMIIVVAAFMIVATLIMLIMEKSSDIAILKTMGAEDAVIERIFAVEGTLIGLVGTGLGVVAGVMVTTQLDWIQRWVESLFGIDALPQNVYPLSHFPWEFDVVQISVVVTLSMVLSLGATLLPSRQAARLDPAEALRYE
jgi:lipoprotein-releasing system permease protein